jgi:DNA-binding LacI/PurR family transcriptional regulator
VRDPAAEMAVYRQWFAERRVDAAVMVNPTVADPRLPLLEQLGLPCVIVGDTRGVSEIPAVWTDDAEATDLAVAHLVELGHRRIAWVGGQATLLHSSIRQTAFRAAIGARGLATDLLFEAADDAATDAVLARLLGQPDRPTAIIFEHQIAAMRGLNQLRERGLDVPTDVSVMSWDDDPLCRLTNPTLTALRRDAFDYGQVVGTHLLALLAGEPVGNLRGTRSAAIARRSTGPAPPG